MFTTSHSIRFQTKNFQVDSLVHSNLMVTLPDVGLQTYANTKMT